MRPDATCLPCPEPVSAAASSALLTAAAAAALNLSLMSCETRPPTADGASRAASDACRSLSPDCGRSSVVDLKTCIACVARMQCRCHQGDHLWHQHANTAGSMRHASMSRKLWAWSRTHPNAMLAAISPVTIVAGPICPGKHTHATLLTVLPFAVISVA
jgi:hypothetical protein